MAKKQWKSPETESLMIGTTGDPVSTRSFIVSTFLPGTSKPCKVLGYGRDSPREMLSLVSSHSSLLVPSAAHSPKDGDASSCCQLVSSVKLAVSRPKGSSSAVVQTLVFGEPGVLIPCRRQNALPANPGCSCPWGSSRHLLLWNAQGTNGP